MRFHVLRIVPAQVRLHLDMAPGGASASECRQDGRLFPAALAHAVEDAPLATPQMPCVITV